MKDIISQLKDPIIGSIEDVINMDDSIKSCNIRDVIQIPAVLRLNNIRQLSFTYYTYLGGTHTRLSHSLGVMYGVCKTLTTLKEEVEIENNDICIAALAALLHDIGHGPFGHALESFLRRIKGKEVGVPPEQFKHSYYTYRFIKNGMFGLKELAKRKGLDLESIADLAIGCKKDKFKRKWMGYLFDDTMDLDRIDFLLRDSYFTGYPLPPELRDKNRKDIVDEIAKGVCLLPQDSFGSVDNFDKLQEEYGDLNTEYLVAYKENAYKGLILPLIKLYLDMYNDVYLNWCNRVSQEMIAKALAISYDRGEIVNLDYIYTLVDHELITFLTHDTTYDDVNELASRVLERNLYEPVIEAYPPKETRLEEAISKELNLEKEIEEECGISCILEPPQSKEMPNGVIIEKNGNFEYVSIKNVKEEMLGIYSDFKNTEEEFQHKNKIVRLYLPREKTKDEQLVKKIKGLLESSGHKVI